VSLPTGSVSAAIFNTTVLITIGWSCGQGQMLSEDLSLHCKPVQALYNVKVTYQDGAQTFNVRTDPDSIRELVDVLFGCFRILRLDRLSIRKEESYVSLISNRPTYW